jgi:hypothetical protein
MNRIDSLLVGVWAELVIRYQPDSAAQPYLSKGEDELSDVHGAWLLQ